MYYNNFYKMRCASKSSSRLIKYLKYNVRNYHSEHVFGFKRKYQQTYQVPLEVLASRCKQSNFYRLVTAYRVHAHKCADINPVAFTKNCSPVPQLDYSRYGFSSSDTVSFKHILNINKDSGTIEDAINFLNAVYSKTISAEFMHLENEEEREWFANRIESLPNQKVLNEEQVSIAKELLKSQALDNFLAKRFTGLKRYGGEGAESMLAFFNEIFKLSADSAVEQLVIAMPHRGRLNLLTGMLNYRPVRMFCKLRGNPDFPSNYTSTGDVLSHIISSTDLQYNNNKVHVSVLYNPSHLEAVNPVSMGKTRAKQMTLKDGDYGENRWSEKVLNIQVHGDAAIIGQGVNQECLSLSGAPHFDIGGSIHLVVNNQLGFTTPADRGRSSRYCTDIAKIIAVPVIHVNGDYPEDVLKASRLAFEYQRLFRKDVFIDLNCFRRWGHNEMDDPTFTNPALYDVIQSRGTVPDLYSEQLVKDGIMSEQDCRSISENHYNWLHEELMAVDKYEPEDVYFKNHWEGYVQPDEVVSVWHTGVDTDLLTFLGSQSVKYPTEFNIHPTILRTHVKNRLEKVAEGINIDWSTAETMALGSLIFEGYNVRISGQDVGRGTFSQRHVMLVDQQTNQTFIPLNNMHENQMGFLEIANSILSEEAVLGYEYGMSIESPTNLIIWEAQFGDFFNGAQVILDTFVSSGEAKWIWQSGLTILLPHGYDGAGPEHSSARIERFLQLTDSKEDSVDGDTVNMQVCNPSTPAQYFHLLRRQMVRNFRKPLIVITPKILLRSAACTSDFVDMAPNTYFKPVIGDPLFSSDPLRVDKVLIASGKHYYSLLEKRGSVGSKNTAIVSLESYCPFPTLELRQEIEKYTNAKSIIWCQEEPQNMGAWSFVKPRFENLVGRKLIYCGRPTLPTTAVGIGRVHLQQASEVVTKPFLIE